MKTISLPAIWWNFPTHCSSCISREAASVCEQSWSCTRTLEIGGFGKQSDCFRNDHIQSATKLKAILFTSCKIIWTQETHFNDKLSNANFALSTSTFSTTCFPNEQTLEEHVIVIFSFDSYLNNNKTSCINFRNLIPIIIPGRRRSKDGRKDHLTLASKLLTDT